MKHMIKVKTLLFVLVIALSSCNKAPKCSIDTPADNQTFTIADSIFVKVTAEDKDGSIAHVSLFINNNLHAKVEESPYDFVIPSGTLTEGTYKLKIEAADNEGKVGEANISIVVNPKLFTIGEMYDVGGIQGQVYKISDEGKHGMIRSLDFVKLSWGNELDQTSAQDENDGVANMNRIKNNFNIENYPAFKWCEEKNTNGVSGWYLPAINEVVDMHSVKTQLNIPFSGEYGVWSSTEQPDETGNAFFKAFNLDSPFNQKGSKYKKYVVIAVRKF